MAKKMSTDKLIILVVSLGIVGFFAVYALTYEEKGPEGETVAAAPVDATPVRQLEPSPAKGAETPKVFIHEVSEFQ